MMEENVLPYPQTENQIPLTATEPDPDNPQWGVVSGFGVWLASIFVLFMASALGAAIWLMVLKARGEIIPLQEEEMKQVLLSEGSILIQMAMNIIAHLATIAICWAVATSLGKRSFAESIGWDWRGPTALYKVALVVGISIVSIFIVSTLPRIIHDSQSTPFAEMLKTSQTVRYSVAFLAVFTAPITEELVYRGLVYSPLKRAIGMVGAIITATMLFALVHVPQYWGAWGSLTGLLLLSLMLTVVRAKTKSIFPSVWIHALFNSIGAIGIILGKE
ncbi:MAG: CPBP family intramembrane glutamic endopeptidase [Acidobacteriota bacterium]